MGSSQTIVSDLKQAMLDKEVQKVSVLRMVVAALKNKQIEKGSDLTDDESLAILKKEAKKRNESIEVYKKAGRMELVEKEEGELKILSAYLPETMSKEEVVKRVGELKEKGALGANFGEAMKAAMAEFKGQADGKLIAEVIKETL